MKENKEKKGSSIFIEILVMILVIIIAFFAGFIVSRKAFLDIDGYKKYSCFISTKLNAHEYVELNEEISGVVTISSAELMEGTENYRLKGVKYVPYELSEAEYQELKTNNTYTLADGEYEYVVNEENQEELLRNSETGKEYIIEKSGIKTYSLTSVATGNELLAKTEKYVYVNVSKDIQIEDEEGNVIGTVEEYFTDYTPQEADGNGNPATENVFYFEFSENEDGENQNNCTGIINIDTNLE